MAKKEIIAFDPPTEEEIMLIQPNNVTFGQYNVSEWQENLLTLIGDKIQKHMTREEELPRDLFNQPYVVIMCDEAGGKNNKNKVLKEAIDMLQAMNTGHDGSLSTGHSNSAKDMISRLETMVLMGMDMPSAAVKQQIASAIDLIVHLGRMRDKSRKVLQIAEVLNLQNGEIPLRTIYEFEEQGKGEDGKVEGKLVRRAETLENNAKMAAAGITGY